MFAMESGLEVPTAQKKSNVLEMKWTSVVRLKKQVMELETRLKDMTDHPD